MRPILWLFLPLLGCGGGSESDKSVAGPTGTASAETDSGILETTPSSPPTGDCFVPAHRVDTDWRAPRHLVVDDLDQTWVMLAGIDDNTLLGFDASGVQIAEIVETIGTLRIDGMAARAGGGVWVSASADEYWMYSVGVFCVSLASSPVVQPLPKRLSRLHAPWPAPG